MPASIADTSPYLMPLRRRRFRGIRGQLVRRRLLLSTLLLMLLALTLLDTARATPR